MWLLVGEDGRIYGQCESYQACFRVLQKEYPSFKGEFFEKGAGIIEPVLPAIMNVVSEKYYKGEYKYGK